METFIGKYEISHDICDKLIQNFHDNEQFHTEGRISKEDKADDGYVNKKSKESTDYQVINADDVHHEYLSKLQHCLNLYMIHYPQVDLASKFNICEPMNIQHYKPNQGFKAYHFERSGNTIQNCKRYLVFMTYLNDVEDGGTEFLYQNIITPAVKGSTIIWPAEWTHTHRGQISRNHEKYIITGWLSFLV